MTQAESPVSFPELILVAPVDGIVGPLEDLPDAVFAEKMLGDGISIDPTGSRVVAPCAGVITQLHRAHHALTIRTETNVSILVHVGLDTVTLAGKGFSPLVSEGDRVAAGQPLIDFDLDVIAQQAQSAQVEIVVTEGAENLTFKRQGGEVVAGVDEIVRVSSAPRSELRHRKGAGPEKRVELQTSIVNPNGMHARPAARLSQVARSFQAQVSLGHGHLSASATSVTGIMGLDLTFGSTVRILAVGSDAEKAAQAIRDAIANGLGEAPGTHEAPTDTKLVSTDEKTLGGIAASPGLAIGTVVTRSLTLPTFSPKATDQRAEKAQVAEGMKTVKAELRAESESYKNSGETEKAQIFAAHRELLDDDTLLTETEVLVSGGASGASAWQKVAEERTKQLLSLKSPLLRQRAIDMQDVSRRVLFSILKEPMQKLALDRESILVCEDLTPSMAAELRADSIGGIITELGGSTSHAAIIARSLGVPYVAGVGKDIGQLTSGRRVIVDGVIGAIHLDPTREQAKQAEIEITRKEAERKSDREKAHGRAQTLDGFEIEVGANIGSAKDAEQGVEHGCDGVGLLRSEFLFLGRREAPSEDEQRAQYEQIARTLGKERSLVIRTLDVGGDKPLSYIPLAEEENPFLGIRGLRLSFKFPELFRAQIRAALAAAKHTKLNLMFPMVATPGEFSRAKSLVRSEMRDLDVDKARVAVGVMVEVPSAALNARWLAKEADFFSIGTNDLTQYTLAMDRGHSELSEQADAFEPSVLRLIQMTVEAAHAEGKWVGVCGSLAAEPLATPLLLGLCLDELSVPVPVVPELKARIKRLRRDACQAIAEGALALPSATHVRALVSSFQGAQPKD